MHSSYHSPGLARCRFCEHPVPAPVGLFERSLFRFSTCPGCNGRNPHPQELIEWQHTARTARRGSAFLIAAVAAIRYVPIRELIDKL
ncbi:MAG: hypothetical protein GY711_29585 [bacterium]|nr:hypothetical protein [bacterium]